MRVAPLNEKLLNVASEIVHTQKCDLASKGLVYKVGKSKADIGSVLRKLSSVPIEEKTRRLAGHLNFILKNEVSANTQIYQLSSYDLFERTGISNRSIIVADSIAEAEAFFKAKFPDHCDHEGIEGHSISARACKKGVLEL